MSLEVITTVYLLGQLTASVCVCWCRVSARPSSPGRCASHALGAAEIQDIIISVQSPCFLSTRLPISVIALLATRATVSTPPLPHCISTPLFCAQTLLRT